MLICDLSFELEDERNEVELLVSAIPTENQLFLLHLQSFPRSTRPHRLLYSTLCLVSSILRCNLGGATVSYYRYERNKQTQCMPYHCYCIDLSALLLLHLF